MPDFPILRTPESRFADIADYPWEPHYVDVADGLRMAWVDAGPRDARETLLLLHGEPMWGYLYRKLIPTLEAAGCRVVVPDLIGFGRSDKPTDPEAYTYSGHVAWVKALVEHLDLRGVTFFGQDWGGLIGGRLVAENEARFARAVFSNTALPSSQMPSLPGVGRQERLTPEALKSLLGIDWRDSVDGDDRIVGDRVHAMVVPGPGFYFPVWRVYSQEVETFLPSKIVPAWCLEPVAEAALAAYDAPFPTPDHTVGARRFPMLVPLTKDDPERARCDAAWEVFRRWQKPALTLWGDHCPFTNQDLGRSFQSAIPGARLPGVEHAVFRASHFIQEDLGEELARRILGLIEATP